MGGLRRAVQETLRLHPTKPLSRPWRALEDVKLEGYVVAKGQAVVINTWALGRDER